MFRPIRSDPTFFLPSVPSISAAAAATLNELKCPFRAGRLTRLARCNSFVLSVHCCTLGFGNGIGGGRRANFATGADAEKRRKIAERKEGMLHSDDLIVEKKFFVPPLFRGHAHARRLADSRSFPLLYSGSRIKTTRLFICTAQTKSCGKFRLRDSPRRGGASNNNNTYST